MFASKEHKKLEQLLNKFDRAVVVGNRKDGLYIFLDFFASKKIGEGYAIKKRLFEAEEDQKF